MGFKNTQNIIQTFGKAAICALLINLAACQENDELPTEKAIGEVQTELSVAVNPLSASTVLDYAPYQEVADLIDGNYIDDVNWGEIALDLENYLKDNLELSDQAKLDIRSAFTFQDSGNFEDIANNFAMAFQHAYDGQIGETSYTFPEIIELMTYRTIFTLDRDTHIRINNTSSNNSTPSNVQDKMISSHIGYFSLRSFSNGADTDIDAAIQRLKDQGATAFIFDLRGNKGGYIDEAIAISDNFLEKGLILTEIEGSTTTEHYATGNDDIDGMPLIILIDDNSASSAEIVTAALKENGRSIVLGQNSYGKGVFQKIFNLSTNDEFRLTGGFQLTPSGSNVQNIGLPPTMHVGTQPHTSQQNRPARSYPNPLNIDEYPAQPDSICTVKQGENMSILDPEIRDDETLLCALETLQQNRVFTSVQPFTNSF